MIRTISGLNGHQQRQLVANGCSLGMVGSCLLCTRSIAMFNHNALICVPSLIFDSSRCWELNTYINSTWFTRNKI